jgi:AraC-like DNA-binding protein
LQVHRHITEIAFGWGFNELTHFSRAFKERYGVSPRDWRHRSSR